MEGAGQVVGEKKNPKTGEVMTELDVAGRDQREIKVRQEAQSWFCKNTKLVVA